MIKRIYALLAVAALIAPPAMAQPKVQTPGGTAPGASIGYGPKDGTWTPVTPSTPMPTSGKQEYFALATGNVAAAAQTAFGGAYVFSQTCAGYNGGSLVMRYRGPDGVTMLSLVSKTASDSAGGTLITLGAGAVVDVSLPNGASGCSATLARVP